VGLALERRDSARDECAHQVIGCGRPDSFQFLDVGVDSTGLWVRLT
jgi:hypothetical protein